jgi:hypothetical protein
MLYQIRCCFCCFLSIGCSGYFWNISLNGVKLVQELSCRGEEMDIQSVTSSISAYTNSSTQASQAQQVQQAEKREPRPEERVERTEEPPRPVKNAQGQETGTLVNVTA